MEAAMTMHGSPGLSQTRRWLLLATMVLGTTLAVLDNSILNILVVPLMETFQADLRTVKWALTSYNVVLAMFMIGFGSLGDTIGRRRLYMLGQVVFVGGSVLAAVAGELWQLIAARALQGLGTAALAPNALALIRDSFPAGERGAALGLWAAAVGLGEALGFIVGGLVGQAWGWRALFLLNVPVGLLVVAAAYGLLVPDPPRRQRFDTPGFIALSGTLLAFSMTLTTMPPLDRGWGKGSVAVLALVLGVVFVLIERRTLVPLLDLGIIRQPAVIATHVSVFCAVVTMAGGMFLSVLYAQLLTDATLATVGVLLAPCAVATFTVALGAGWLAEKISPRVLVVTGLLVLTMSVVLPALWHPASASALVFWHNLLAGTGLGLATPALLQVATEMAGQERTGMGAGLYKTVHALGGGLGVVLLGTLLEARIVGNTLRQLPGYFLPQELSLKTIASFKLLETHAVQKGLALQELDGFHRTLVEAVQGGFAQVFGLTALLAGIGVVAGFLVPRRLEGRPDAR